MYCFCEVLKLCLDEMVMVIVEDFGYCVYIELKLVDGMSVLLVIDYLCCYLWCWLKL